MAYRKPIVHGNFSNDIPDKCTRCANCTRNTETGRQECNKREDGKFVPTIAFGCFTRKG